MADLHDIGEAFKGLIVPALYPNGTSNPSALPGAPAVKVYQGWPVSQDLQNDIAALAKALATSPPPSPLPGFIHVSIFPRPDEKNTSRLNQADDAASQATPGLTLTAVIAGNTATLTAGGAPAVGDQAAVILNGQSFGYAVVLNDTPTTVAAALLALIEAAGFTASAAGPVLTVLGVTRGKAFTAGAWTVLRELKRQERSFQISCWAPTPALRGATAALVDAALAAVYRLSLPDGTQTLTRFLASHQDDGDQKVLIYRRDLFYAAEWATTAARQVPTVTLPILETEVC